MARTAAVRSITPVPNDEAGKAAPKKAARPMSLANGDTPYSEAVGARQLQAMIAGRLDGPLLAEIPAADDRWSPRASVAFMLFSSLGLWGAIAAVVVALRG